MGVCDTCTMAYSIKESNQIGRLFDDIDANRDNSLSWEEISLAMGSENAVTSEEVRDTMGDQMDPNSDGIITREEFKGFCAASQWPRPGQMFEKDFVDFREQFAGLGEVQSAKNTSGGPALKKNFNRLQEDLDRVEAERDARLAARANAIYGSEAPVAGTVGGAYGASVLFGGHVKEGVVDEDDGWSFAGLGVTGASIDRAMRYTASDEPLYERPDQGIFLET